MATIEQLRGAMRAAPPGGFTVRLSSGDVYWVRHRDFISVPATDRGRAVTIQDDEGFHLIDLLHIVELGYPDPGDIARDANRQDEGGD